MPPRPRSQVSRLTKFFLLEHKTNELAVTLEDWTKNQDKMLEREKAKLTSKLVAEEKAEKMGDQRAAEAAAAGPKKAVKEAKNAISAMLKSADKAAKEAASAVKKQAAEKKKGEEAVKRGEEAADKEREAADKGDAAGQQKASAAAQKAADAQQKAADAQKAAAEVEQQALQDERERRSKIPSLEAALEEAERMLAPFQVTLDAAKAEMAKWKKSEAAARFAPMAEIEVEKQRIPAEVQPPPSPAPRRASPALHTPPLHSPPAAAISSSSPPASPSASLAALSSPWPPPLQCRFAAARQRVAALNPQALAPAPVESFWRSRRGARGPRTPPVRQPVRTSD